MIRPDQDRRAGRARASIARQEDLGHPAALQRPRNLAVCLDLLDRQTLPRDAFEVVVADNNSRCGLAAVASRRGPRARHRSAVQGAGERATRAVPGGARRGARLHQFRLPSRAAMARAGPRGARDRRHRRRPGRRDGAHRKRPTPVEAFELAFAFNTRRYVLDHHYCVTANMFVRRDVFDSSDRSTACPRTSTGAGAPPPWASDGLRARRGRRAPGAARLGRTHAQVEAHRAGTLQSRRRAAARPLALVRRTSALLATPATGVVEVLMNPICVPPASASTPIASFCASAPGGSSIQPAASERALRGGSSTESCGAARPARSAIRCFALSGGARSAITAGFAFGTPHVRPRTARFGDDGRSRARRGRRLRSPGR